MTKLDLSLFEKFKEEFNNKVETVRVGLRDNFT